MQLRRLALVPCIAFAAACSAGETSSYVALNALPATLSPKPRPAASVEIFSTPHVQRPYLEVGVVGIAGTWNALHTALPSWDELVAALREHAGQRGCDALYLIGRVDNFIQGTCLVYTDSATQPAAARAAQ